jgi:hypothetical protein
MIDWRDARATLAAKLSRQLGQPRDSSGDGVRRDSSTTREQVSQTVTTRP